MIRNLVLSVVFVLVLASSVQASFEIDHPEKISVVRGETARVDVRISNDQDFNDSFRFSTDSIDWRVTSDPLSDFFSGVEIDAGDSRTVSLLLNANSILEFGIHNLDLSLRSEEGGDEKNIPLSIEVRSKHQSVARHAAAVKASVSINPRNIDPSEPFTVVVELSNRNPRDLENLKVKMMSETFNAEVDTSLGPLENKTIEKTFNLDNPSMPPLFDTLTVEMVYEGNVLNPVLRESFEIGRYPKTIESVTEKKEFMKNIITMTYENVGNAPDTVELPSLTGESAMWNKPGLIFVRPINFESGEEVVLNPGVSKTYSVSVNYRLLLTIPILILIIAGIIAINHFMQSPIKVKKSAKVVRLRDRGISSFKVFIHVKNASHHPYENITITDNVSSPVRLMPGHDSGAMKPNSTYHDGRRSIIKWKIKKLEPLEERVFSYNAKTRIALVGSMTLPPVNVRFHTNKGIKMLTRSKKIKLSGDSAKKK